MYSFLLAAHTVTARPRPEEAYEFFTYNGASAVAVSFRGRDIKINKGDRFGVRPSRNGKFVRLVFPNDPNRVITVDQATAERLAKGVKT